MPQLAEVTLATLADWLRIEVLADPEGRVRPVVRYRLHHTGKWEERHATPQEVQLYDAVRALVVDRGERLEPLVLVARALSLSPSATGAEVLEEIAILHEHKRRNAEGIKKLAAALASAEREIGQLKNAPRLAPQGGDRNELARQIRRLAFRKIDQEDAARTAGRSTQELFHQGSELRGFVACANTILQMIGGEKVPL